MDHRPLLERQAPWILTLGYLAIATSTVAGGVLGAQLMLHLTAPKE